MTRFGRRTRVSGFTLIELLVVIAIIAILAAILFPAFVSAKEHAQQVRCLSNLKNIASAMRMYADDNTGVMPSCGVRKDRWDGVLSPYPADWCGSVDTWQPVYPEKGSLWVYTGRARGLFLCPSDLNKPATDYQRNPEGMPRTLAEAKAYPLSYSMNIFLHRLRVESALMPSISKMLLLIHEDRSTINDGIFMWGGVDANGKLTVNMDIPDRVHYTGTTVAYLDGHVAWKPHNTLIQERNKLLWLARAK